MKAKTIYDLEIVPYIIADRAAWDVMEEDKRCSNWLPHQMQELADKTNKLLCDKADVLFLHSDHFKKQMTNKRKDQRYTLEMFMSHWFRRLLEQHFKGQPLSF